jgi:spermidine synthase
MVSVNHDGQLTQQSAMSLLRPEKLIYDYERLMTLAFAAAPEPRSALLLGLGSGTTARFARRYFPDTELTIVERDDTVTRLARDWFGFAGPVIDADANEFVAETECAFDAVLVDLYDGGGFAEVQKRFWDNAYRLLRPKGCLAVNWADPDKNESYRAHAARLARLAEATLFATPRGFKDNTVQFASSDPAFSQRALRLASVALAKKQRRRDILDRCAILDRLP